jgi:hypothetical protein
VEFPHAKRFSHVVVDARFQRRDLILLVVLDCWVMFAESITLQVRYPATRNWSLICGKWSELPVQPGRCSDLFWARGSTRSIPHQVE